MIKNIIILGSTGSIGRSTLNVIKKNNGKYKIKLLSTNNNIKKILSQCLEFKVKNVLIKNKKKFQIYKNIFKKNKINVYFNIEDAIKIIKKKVFYTINAISGINGLYPTILFVKYSENIAIANKESIICGWELIKKELIKNKTNFIPIDSEHFSIWSLLKNENMENVYKIFLTASGGPFLYKNPLLVKNVKPKIALKHPNWKMGKKISIDSATMMNKVFEVIEAKKIFNMNYDKFEIIIHPKSYIHAIIQLKSGLLKFLAHRTTMEIPIQNSLISDNEKLNYCYKVNDLNKLNGINFIKPNFAKFPLLKILKIIPKNDSYFETILIAINDELVLRYLNKEINYSSIHIILLKLIKKPYFAKYYKKKPKDINDIIIMVKRVKLYLQGYLKV